LILAGSPVSLRRKVKEWWNIEPFFDRPVFALGRQVLP